MAVIEKRADSNPSDSYVAKLLHAPNDQVLKKIGEEATEVLLAVKGGDKNEVINEVDDLFFHLLVSTLYKLKYYPLNKNNYHF